MLLFLINCIFRNKEFHYNQLVQMKDTASIFMYMMCRKIYDPTSNIIIDQWVRTLSFFTLLNRGKNG